MKDLRWQQVVLVLAVLGMLTFLVWQGKDGSNVINWLLPLLVSLGVAYQVSDVKKDVSATRENTNGNVAQLLRQLESKDRTIKEMADKMADMQPAPKDEQRR